MKKLREIMRAGFLFVVQRGATVREAVQVMTANNVGIVLVLEGERLVGVFSERDVVRRVVDRGAQMLSMISIRDLIRVDMQDKGEEIRYLREYLYQVPPEPARPTARS